MNTSIEFVRRNADQTNEEEVWYLNPDTRHGRKGWRVSRYVATKIGIEEILHRLPDQARSNPETMNVIHRLASRVRSSNTNMIWDEWYMFFETLDAAHDAFQRGDLSEGRIKF